MDSMTQQEKQWADLVTSSVDSVRKSLNERQEIPVKDVYDLLNRAEALVHFLQKRGEPEGAPTC
ncbi:MAG TPA: hypothetical protein VH593_30750 [Ktedonobacteraceae bacterium]